MFSIDRISPATKPALLIDPTGKAVCDVVDLAPFQAAISKIREHGFLLGERHGADYLEGLEFKDEKQQKYVFLIRGTYPTQVYIPYREILPRLLIGLIISVLVTFGITHGHHTADWLTA